MHWRDPLLLRLQHKRHMSIILCTSCQVAAILILFFSAEIRKFLFLAYIQALRITVNSYTTIVYSSGNSSTPFDLRLLTGRPRIKQHVHSDTVVTWFRLSELHSVTPYIMLYSWSNWWWPIRPKHVVELTLCLTGFALFLVYSSYLSITQMGGTS